MACRRSHETVAAVAVLAVFTALHSSGLRLGSTITSVASATIGVLLLALIVACLPRVLFSMAREGWISQKAAAVNRGGTPYAALLATTLTSSAMILTGTFSQLIVLFAVLILLYYIAAFLAVFVLRGRSPDLPRPYKAFGYPVTTFIVLAGSAGFLIAAVVEDWRSGAMALLFLSLCIPAYALASRSRRARMSEFAAEPELMP